MRFDDGIIRLYQIVYDTQEGGKPNRKLNLYDSFYFGYETLGINRYYTALKANEQIEAVVHIQGWLPLNVSEMIAVMENDVQYRIPLAQPTLDEFNLRITRLSLERIDQEYDIIDDQQS